MRVQIEKVNKNRGSFFQNITTLIYRYFYLSLRYKQGYSKTKSQLLNLGYTEVIIPPKEYCKNY